MLLSPDGPRHKRRIIAKGSSIHKNAALRVAAM